MAFGLNSSIVAPINSCQDSMYKIMKKLMKILARLHNNLLNSISDILYLKKFPFDEGLDRCEKDNLAKNNFFGTVPSAIFLKIS